MSPAPPTHRDKTSVALSSGKQSHAASAGKCTHEMERDRIGLWGSGDSTAASQVSGLDRLRHPGLNKVTFHTVYNISFIILRSMTAYFRLGHGFDLAEVLNSYSNSCHPYVHQSSWYKESKWQVLM